MKIFHIIAGAEHGGAESCAVDTISALHRAGVDQVLVCRPYDHFLPFKEQLNGKFHTVNFNRLNSWLDTRKINRLIGAEEPDLVHCWMNRAASVIKKQIETPVLGWFGGYYDLKYYKNCDFYMGVTKDIVSYINKNSQISDRAYLGHPFGTLEKKNNLKKSDFGIPEDSKVVLLLSRMHQKKGVDLLIQAAKRIEGVYFLLAGDGPELSRYKALATRLGVSDRVIFPGWCEDRLALLQLADVCTLPSRYEPFGIVMTEAWFAGVPLVATRAAGARHYVTDGVDGLLLEIDDLNGLVDAIKRCLQSTSLRRKLVLGGKETYKNQFSRDAIIKKLINSYEDMISRYQQFN